MKKIVLTALTFILVVSTTHLCIAYFGSRSPVAERLNPAILPAKNDPVQNTDIFNELAGIWLNKEYFTSLYKTRSPFKSAHGIFKSKLDIMRNGSIYECMEIWIFREGGPVKKISGLNPVDRNTYLLTVFADYVDGEKQLSAHYLVVNQQTNRLEIHFEEEGQKFEFVKIGDSLDNYINEVVLAGKYKDNKNNTYTFGINGEASWPGKRFRYLINVDPYNTSGNEFDFFFMKDNDDVLTGEQYAFEWKGNKLFIYGTRFIEGGDSADFLEKDKEPLLRLEKVNF